MTNKITTPHDTKKEAKVTHPGSEHGNPAARIKKKEVAAAFGRKRAAK
jgi:hypothetical protein